MERSTREQHFRDLMTAGVSSRRVGGLMPPGTPGVSSSSFSRWFKKDSLKRLRKMQTRRFDRVPIVEVSLDMTYVAGPEGESRQVTIVTGVTGEGQRLALGYGFTPGENSDDIHKLLRGVVERGVDPRALFVADQGEGIRAAVERLTYPEKPKRQLCTTHAARIVAEKLPEEVQKDWRLQMYGAWSENDPETALGRLRTTAAELDEAGFDTAASSLRRCMDDTVTVQGLGLTGDIRRQLRSTNAQEATNALVKNSGSFSNVTWWRDDEMVDRWIAWQLVEIEETKWTRLADPEQLIGLAETLFPGRYDHQAILAELPPTMSVEKLPVSVGDDGRTEEFAARWCEENPDAVWFGSPAARGALGLDAAKELTPAALLDALRCRDPETGESLRPGEQVSVERLGADGRLTEETIDGILDLEWELTASPGAMGEWRKGGAARERVEAKLTEAAETAVAHATRTTSPHHGSVGIMALRRPSAEEPDRPLSVAGISFAVQRGKSAKLASPAAKKRIPSKVLRDAESAAKAVLHEGLGAAPGRSATELEGNDSRPDRELIAGVEARALQIAPRMVGAEREELEALAGGLAAAREGLGEIDREVRDWGEASWGEASQEIAAARMRPRSPSGRSGGAWRPLDPGQRLLLGERRSQLLLGDAAVLSGVAAGDAETARELDAIGEPQLAGLRQPLARVEAAAEAIAAGRELERRRLFELAREETGRAPPPLELRDSRGELAADPIDRNAAALGPERVEALRGSAAAFAGELRDLDDPALRRLTAATASAWNALDPRTGIRLLGLERERDALLDGGLRALQASGRLTAAAQEAAGNGDGIAFVEGERQAEVAKGPAREQWQKLREIEDQLSELRQTPGSPDSLLADYPRAAVHHAARAELSRRERERSRLLQTNRKEITEMPINSNDKQNDLTPTFKAERLVVVPGEAGPGTSLPAAGSGGWRWLGDREVLGRHGVEGEGQEVTKTAYGRFGRGQNVTDRRTVVREPAIERRGNERVSGFVQVHGSCAAAEPVLVAWSSAEPDEKATIRDGLIAQAKAGIGHLAGTEKFAAAATVVEVGEGAEATLRVDFVALAADRGNGLENPYDSTGVRDFRSAVREARSSLEARVAEVRPAVPEVRPEVEAEGAPTAPVAEAAVPAPRNEVKASSPELPIAPLRDSLGVYRGALGDEIAGEIKVQADAARSELDLGRLSAERLRSELPAADAFAAVPHNPGPFSTWPEDHAAAVVRTTAIEGQLIDNAKDAYAALAEQRGTGTADPIAKVRRGRGEEFATKVERRAAVLASHLGKYSQEQRQEMMAEVSDETNPAQPRDSRFETIARKVALQHGRNIDNEREAAQQLKAGPERGVAPVAAGRDLD